MRKFIVLFLAISLLLLFASCELPEHTPSGDTSTSTKDTSDTSSGTISGDDPDVLIAETALGKVEKLLKLSYSSITVTVVTKTNGITLTDTYVINYYENGEKLIDYVVTEAKEIFVDDEGTITVPDEQYTTYEGTVKILLSGKTEQIKGDAIARDLSTLSTVNFDLSVNNFTDLTVTTVSIKGNIADLNAFLKTNNVTATNPTLSISYGDVLRNIRVNYETLDASVKITYSFNK